MKKHLPNFLTCCNLVCGALGVLTILNFGAPDIDNPLPTPLLPAAIFVWVACVFDFLDGFAARALKVSSPIGKELDSLADMVSFGLLPAVFMFDFIRDQSRSAFTQEQFYSSPAMYLPFVSFVMIVFSALRLAIFNVDETQKDSFRGLPTPANALFITALPFLAFPGADSILSPWGLVAITVVFSFLLVSRIELFALKFKTFGWAENKIRFTFLILSVLLLVIFQVAAVPLIILLYILLSLVDKAFLTRA
jgi:CDP-diacylglycerol---serine O-phosphatidyltransferase